MRVSDGMILSKEVAFVPFQGNVGMWSLIQSDAMHWDNYGKVHLAARKGLDQMD